jgi:hypothetical protein
MVCLIVPADNLTTAIDSYPEYPKIKRTGTRGLPPPDVYQVSSGAWKGTRPPESNG